MATETLLLNQDRCAKNFYTYYHPLKDQWLVLPWDLESSLGMSAGEPSRASAGGAHDLRTLSVQ